MPPTDQRFRPTEQAKKKRATTLLSMTEDGSSTPLMCDILGGITSPEDGHLGWFLEWQVFRIVIVDIGRSISADEYTQ